MINQYCAHSFTRNWQLHFLNQRKGENDRRKYFMINLHERMLPTLAGVEPTTSWSPVWRPPFSIGATLRWKHLHPQSKDCRHCMIPHLIKIWCTVTSKQKNMPCTTSWSNCPPSFKVIHENCRSYRETECRRIDGQMDGRTDTGG